MNRHSVAGFALALGICIAFGFAVAAMAQTNERFPSKPITIILPQPAGGAVDLIARTVAERLSESMGQPVVIENRPGANGGLAGGQVARATPDGYTLFLAVDTNLCVNPNLYPSLAYDPFRDFIPISVIAKLYLGLAAIASLPANNVQELIALAKASPGKLNYGSIGLGTQHHLGMELLKHTTKMDITQINYPGTAPAMTGILRNDIQVMFSGLPGLKAHIESGKLKLLAVASPERSTLMPDVPTMQESGIAGYELSAWFGLLAPANTPKSIVEQLSGEVKKAVNDPRFRSRMAPQGLEIVGNSSEEMLALMRADTAKWLDVIKSTGVKVGQ